METGGITFLGGVAWPQGVMRRVIHCFSTWFSTGINRKKMPRKLLSISFSMLVSERRRRHGRTQDGVRLCHVLRALTSIGNVGKSSGAKLPRQALPHPSKPVGIML